MRSYSLRARALLALALLLPLAPSSFAREPVQTRVNVGATPLLLNVPAGFVHVKDADLVEFAQRFVPATNRLLALLMTQEDLNSWRKLGQAEFKRYFLVQSVRSVENRELTPREFAAVREGFKRRPQEVAERARPTANSTLEKGLSDTGVSVRLDSADVQGIIVDEPDAFARSMTTSYTAKAEGASASMDIQIGLLMLHLRGKVLFVYAYAPGPEEAWVQQQVRGIATQAREANR